MTTADPFSNAHRAAERKAQRDAEQAAQENTTRNRMAAAAKRQADAKSNPNSDIGYRWPKKFYEPGY